MRAAVYYHNGDIRIEDRPVPQIGPGEMLVRVECSGICGSDVMEWYRRPRAPAGLGHEIAGRGGAGGRAARGAGLPQAHSVLVIGSGMAGLLHVKLARANGAGRILATDIHP